MIPTKPCTAQEWNWRETKGDYCTRALGLKVTSKSVMKEENLFHQKKGEWLLDDEWIKIFWVLSMVSSIYFIHTEIFSYWPIHFKDWKPFKCISDKTFKYLDYLYFIFLIGFLRCTKKKWSFFAYGKFFESNRRRARNQ